MFSEKQIQKLVSEYIESKANEEPTIIDCTDTDETQFYLNAGDKYLFTNVADMTGSISVYGKINGGIFAGGTDPNGNLNRLSGGASGFDDMQCFIQFDSEGTLSGSLFVECDMLGNLLFYPFGNEI